MCERPPKDSVRALSKLADKAPFLISYEYQKTREAPKVGKASPTLLVKASKLENPGGKERLGRSISVLCEKKEMLT